MRLIVSLYALAIAGWFCTASLLADVVVDEDASRIRLTNQIVTLEFDKRDGAWVCADAQRPERESDRP